MVGLYSCSGIKLSEQSKVGNANVCDYRYRRVKGPTITSLVFTAVVSDVESIAYGRWEVEAVRNKVVWC